MQSFRSEIENPVVEQDIIELEKKIRLFNEGSITDESFRSLRLARGIYGQRQPGVQMIRIKLPYGKVTSNQLLRISDVSDRFSTGRLHITTRQDIQIHYVSIDDTPELWSQLEQDDVTLREACGNTVRNVTASETAGIDVNEPFDVTPYAHAAFQFFLRNPICQEMGRKFKMSFSSSDADTALSYIHDLGFIPKIKDGERGFRVLLGGGLGSQPRSADLIYEFLPTYKVIPLIESVLRIFDRHGERARRMKARMKFLIKDEGLEKFLELVEAEQKALSNQEVHIEVKDEAIKLSNVAIPEVHIEDEDAYNSWRALNVIPQKQDGLYAIGIKVKLGDFYTDKARKLAALIKDYAADELRFSLRQNILIRHVKEELLPFFYQELKALDFVATGYNATTDITACPGTDTCNLGIASSTGMADELEKVLYSEYPQYINNQDIAIKISGCMNACGQHNMAHIGFQGMSIRTKDKLVAPAVQVLLGGGVLGNGEGRFSDKVIKLPSKRGPQALRLILDDFETNGNPGESFLEYYDRRDGQKYFYNFLVTLSDTENLQPSDFIDWGNKEEYKQEVGVGECAGVVIDLVATLLLEAKEKLEKAEEVYGSTTKWADAIYLAYTASVNAAKALLLSEDVKTNSQANIIGLFDETFIASNKITLDTNSSFSDFIYEINKNEPTKEFATTYINQTKAFFNTIDVFRTRELVYANN
ncbi:nitrite and sulphite reductase 4Fe-4S region [Formosa agariphila KMM 3901]|uniref:Nitrite and sulphite reductase 4Fe-4S region n=1 Tax=Formosa agariphila (strain DSM 15362 / KCTC 12365 / LMG 23005 / KMM 3901 / M-2Alg 35-1) TaxID=1347342 RepID=T2KGW8_FORAG|nr:HEPN domain-containing protein [Formosa agariphila]CDF78067.1 nitrite and sulphite reductase 4Fe-4S region [Formosa agariphila KMM 3901]